MSHAQWQHLADNLPHGWWYRHAALPVTLFALLLPFISLFIIRSQARWWKRFCVLLSAQIPLLLNLPAALIAWNALIWLPRLGIRIHELPTLEDIAAIERLVLLALSGTAAGLPIIGLWLLLNHAPLIRPLKTTTATFTTLATGLIGLQHTTTLRATPAGTLTIQNGLRRGTVQAVRSRAIIGRAGDIPLPDSSVASRHAQLHLDGTQAALSDLGSPHGTFLQRGAATLAIVPGSRQLLLNGDRLLLGDPAAAETIVLLYTKEV